jgi:hypothetical protein
MLELPENYYQSSYFNVGTRLIGKITLCNSQPACYWKTETTHSIAEWITARKLVL